MDYLDNSRILSNLKLIFILTIVSNYVVLSRAMPKTSNPLFLLFKYFFYAFFCLWVYARVCKTGRYRHGNMKPGNLTSFFFLSKGIRTLSFWEMLSILMTLNETTNRMWWNRTCSHNRWIWTELYRHSSEVSSTRLELKRTMFTYRNVSFYAEEANTVRSLRWFSRMKMFSIHPVREYCRWSCICYLSRCHVQEKDLNRWQWV
jgi:hypothetical protein